jgi:alpha-beta hydrolase superfamily lysophospholipase
MKILLSFLIVFPCFGASMNFKFHEPLVKNPKGIIFFAHGLNTKASGYSTLYQSLKDKGYQVFAPVLPGHDEYENFGRVPDTEIDNFMDSAIEFIRQQNLPLTFMGHSFGALCFIQYFYFQEKYSKDIFERIIYLAPAIITKYNRIIRWLPRHWAIPSLSAKRYRRYNKTPMVAYYQIGRLAYKASLALSKLSHAEFVLTKYDELVKSKKLAKALPKETKIHWYKKNPGLPDHYLFLPMESEYSTDFFQQLF